MADKGDGSVLDQALEASDAGSPARDPHTPPEGAAARTVRVGVCAMEKKTSGKPMKQILKRLQAFVAHSAADAEKPEFEFIIWKDEVTLNEPVENWPLCDCLLSWFSDGFPIDKAIAYAQLRNPHVMNNLEVQRDVLLDRRHVYQKLMQAEIPVSRHVVMSREPGSTDVLVEDEDWVEVNGERINKPFVEKPVDAEDHNVYIYYPMSAGGGSKRLFRKVANRSSENYPDHNTVRTEGTYIYEEFLRTEGTDIKVYTVGANYAHAEARKSPALDGRVNRAEDGTEMRFPVVLTMPEKLYARKVVQAFGQNVCGFDLLRTATGSYVCDVNGWSFVKKSTKYYDDCSIMLRSLMLAAVAPWMLRRSPTPMALDDPNGEPTAPGAPALGMLSSKSSSEEGLYELDQMDEGRGGGADANEFEELRCVVVVARHGDRNPKQKLKVNIRHPLFIEIFQIFGKGVVSKKEVKLKTVKQMQHLVEVIRSILTDADVLTETPDNVTGAESISEDERDRLVQVRAALERHSFSGINRKAQLKPLTWASKEDVEAAKKVDGQPALVEGQVTSAMLVMKWGGELTPAGRKQAEELGQRLRKNVYVPYTRGDDHGAGLLRLHSTYRHDFKIYSSDEGRVMMSAASFTKGLLALEGSLTPILVSLVHRDEQMLDESHAAQPTIKESKVLVKHLMLGSDSDEPNLHYTDESARSIGAEVADEPLPNRTIGAMVNLACPREKLEHAYVLIGNVIEEMREMIVDERTDLTGQAEVYNSEKVSIMFGRWVKLHRDFYSKKRGFDLSKVPDLYDCVKFDAIHNSRIKLPSIPELFYVAKQLADFVIPQEYGVTQDQKVETSRKIGSTMFRVMAHHLQWARRDSEQNNPDGFVGGGSPGSGSGGAGGEGEGSLEQGDGAGEGAGADGAADADDDADDDADGDAARTQKGTQLDTSYHTAGDSLMQGLLTPDRQVRTRIYVTSESHVHALLNTLRFGTTRDGQYVLPEEARDYLDDAPELNFLTHFIFKVFERRSDGALRVEVRFSAGANENPMDFYHLDQSPSMSASTSMTGIHNAMATSAEAPTHPSIGGGSGATISSSGGAADGSGGGPPVDFEAVSKEIRAAQKALLHPDGRIGGAELEASIAASKQTSLDSESSESAAAAAAATADAPPQQPEPQPEPEQPAASGDLQRRSSADFGGGGSGGDAGDTSSSAGGGGGADGSAGQQGGGGGGGGGYATEITDTKSALSVANSECLITRIALDDLCYALYPKAAPRSPARRSNLSVDSGGRASGSGSSGGGGGKQQAVVLPLDTPGGKGMGSSQLLGVDAASDVHSPRSGSGGGGLLLQGPHAGADGSISPSPSSGGSPE